ncbi:hypothetical protein P256_00284 [Acinetobacter nectaris CIP 110549]|uniref:HTH araC/xylS-type domain-containing protein n=1 Tax=Acinetobacter nectaris CIP 110549 TaxID=1392540 RepID=V2V1B3_9GAMM|nr:helix-turn-helix domain-containing protein [Acinetobacter nectaris]ESK41294.1 hypothetical protein P256_00284 [Acinetobacter nectaris CIP 110549]
MAPYFFYPSVSLKKHISKYWYWINTPSIPALPPGSGCELFIFNQNVAIYDAAEPEQVHYVNSALIRPRNAPVHFFCQKPISFMSIRFRLGAINYFSDYLESELKTIISAEDIWGAKFYFLRDRILNTPQFIDKIKEIEKFLHQKHNIHTNNKIDLASLFLNEVYYDNNNDSIIDIVHNIGYSQRHLQKTVKFVTGLSLVEAKRLIRFEHTLKYIINKNSIKSNKQDHLLYYYDQSHFIKEFSHFTGISPSKFFIENKDISHFFNQVNSEN